MSSLLKSFCEEAARLGTPHTLRMPMTHEEMCAAMDAKDQEIARLRALVARQTQQHTCSPKELPAGVYWYIRSAGHQPQICEKRPNEDFVRFTNGAHQHWIASGDHFTGPIELQLEPQARPPAEPKA